jgi:hypothetical protein
MNHQNHYDSSQTISNNNNTMNHQNQKSHRYNESPKSLWKSLMEKTRRWAWALTKKTSQINLIHYIYYDLTITNYF